MNEETAKPAETAPESAPATPSEPGTEAHDTPEASGPEAELRELRDALAALRGEMDRYRDEALRARAEVDNARKRAQRDVEAAHKFGVERLVDALIPVKDSLDLGLDAALATTDLKALQEGMALTQQMFQSALEKMGVSAIDPGGARFDPERHQAMMMEASSSAEPGSVLRVLQRGYALHDRVVRPAMVIVAKAPEGT